MSALDIRPLRMDLNGSPAINSLNMAVGVCPSGDMVGIDMVDRVGDTICHGHFDLETAEKFREAINDAIEELRLRLNPQ